MKRLICFLLFFCSLFTSPAWAAITLVQSAQSGTSSTAAFGSNNTAGNLIIVAAHAANTGLTLSVSDTVGNTYTSARKQEQATGVFTVEVFYAKNIGAGANTVTLSGAGGASFRFAILEYSGLDTTTPLDQVNSGTGDAGTALNSGNVTTGTANELLLGAGGAGTGNSFTAGTNYTMRQSVVSGIERLGAEDRIVSSTGTYNATMTIISDNWAMIIATFKMASAGGGAALRHRVIQQ